jgi:hypothetical protein
VSVQASAAQAAQGLTLAAPSKDKEWRRLMEKWFVMIGQGQEKKGAG